MQPKEASGEDLRHYFTVVRRRKGLIALAALVVTGAALVSAFLQTPVYEATAELLLERREESIFDSGGGPQYDPAKVQTQIKVLESRPVTDAVEEQLGEAPDISVEPVGETDVIEVHARSTIPVQAALIANSYATAYIDLQRSQAVNELAARGKELQTKLDDLQRQIDALPSSLDSAERDSLVSQRALFRQYRDQVQVDSSLKSGGAQLVTPAQSPAAPVKPTPRRTGIVAVAVGLTFGVAIAFLFDYLDDSIKNKVDLEHAAPGVTVLGLIPLVTNWKDRRDPRVVSLAEPSSPAAEAYRTLRTSLQFLGLERPLRTLQVTSPNAGEGKSTTLANLAVALGRAGQRVVLVDCDLRRPRIHEFFDLPNHRGLTSLLLGEASISQTVQRVPGEERIWLVASGTLPPNPSELLASLRTAEVLTALQAEADIVLIDTPPVLPVTDASVLSARVDATLLVATAGTTGRKEVGRAFEILRQVDAPLMGTVLNGVVDDGQYGYAYDYYRYEQPPPPRKAGRKAPALKNL